MCCGSGSAFVLPMAVINKPAAPITPAYTDDMVFPMQVKLPSAIAFQAGAPRQLVIKDAAQQIPALVVAWLQSEARYSWWLQELQPEPEPAIVPTETPAPGATVPSEAPAVVIVPKAAPVGKKKA